MKKNLLEISDFNFKEKRECIIMGTKILRGENVAKMSMIELANSIMLEEKKEMSFKTAFEKVATLKEWGEQEKQERISQFYTDLNADGRFVTQGSNVWGLKKWYRKGKGGELIADESQSIERKPSASEGEEVDQYVGKSAIDDEDDDLVDDSLDSTIDDFKDDDYYDEELDDELGEEFDEDDDDF